MSETKNHPWCRDVPRDEAVRAAEDAAAAERTPLPDHRDLPAAVAELRERVARLEAAAAPAANAGGEKPQPPRGWLTEEEREAVQEAADDLSEFASDLRPDIKRAWMSIVTPLRSLLARSTPPKVKGPTGWAYGFIDNAWIAAIRSAGGEVE